MIVDTEGNELRVGDKVAFAALSYRRAELRIGIVEELDQLANLVRVTNPHAARREWRNPKHLVRTA